MVKLTDAQAEMTVYKHLNDYMKKYAQKLQRERNEINQKLSRMDKKGVRSKDYGLLYAKSHVLECQIHHAKMMELEFLKRAMDICDNCDDPLKEAQELYKRITTGM
jgi:hypothetical protein